ncbi:MAG: hypothetical protein J6Y29_05625 [Clostridiales bacterium]|nr:hypothetical protein [Clostridiales bacterium]
MVTVGFTNVMMYQLKELKGKELKSISCVDDEIKKRKFPRSAYGNLFLCVDDMYMEIGNLFRSMNYFGNEEDISTLFCELKLRQSECQHYMYTEIAKEYVIDDIIENIIVIRDKISLYQKEYGVKVVSDNYELRKEKGEKEIPNVKDLGGIELGHYTYNIVLDQALVIKCANNTYIFERGSLFTEEILIRVNKNYMVEIDSVEDVKKYWREGNEGLRIDVEREKIQI